MDFLGHCRHPPRHLSLCCMPLLNSIYFDKMCVSRVDGVEFKESAAATRRVFQWFRKVDSCWEEADISISNPTTASTGTQSF